MPTPLEDFYRKSSRRFGDELARLRTRRRISRWKLVGLLLDYFAATDTPYDMLDVISEAWLARLENGHILKVPMWCLPALVKVLHCTPEEAQRLFDCLTPDFGPLLKDGEIDQSQQPRRRGRPRVDGLSSRQLEVIRLTAEGLRSIDIADQLTVTKETVDTHWIRIRKKLSAETRWDAITIARQQGLI